MIVEIKNTTTTGKRYSVGGKILLPGQTGKGNKDNINPRLFASGELTVKTAEPQEPVEKTPKKKPAKGKKKEVKQDEK